MQRRKTLSNGLVNGGIVKNKAKAIEILKKYGIGRKMLEVKN